MSGPAPRNGTAATASLTVRLTPAERAHVEACAKRDGMSAGAWVRSKVLVSEADIIEPPTPEQRAPCRETLDALVARKEAAYDEYRSARRRVRE